EISNISRPASGHIYFSVKDEVSQIAVVMWRGFAQTLDFMPESGVRVVCYGKPNVYNRSGRLQMVVHRMVLFGEGLLQKRFRELQEKLGREGLFAPERKRPLPYLPKAGGVVTSRSGAVIHDIMTKIRERMPSMTVYLVDVRVQGEEAAEETACGMQELNASGLVDVISVARGG